MQPDTGCYVREILNCNWDAGTWSGEMSVTDCISSCVTSFPNCTAVDYNREESFCYTYNLSPKATYYSYLRANCCDHYDINCEGRKFLTFIVYRDVSYILIYKITNVLLMTVIIVRRNIAKIWFSCSKPSNSQTNR